ncbi:MAG: Hpt domain-containing protein [Bacteroidales bacterium]|jgi:HPt (histidine-containing phosphotransfer) domain-containing protein|nr:Hpt domain-containing protein [Bacteroidales bacterium]
MSAVYKEIDLSYLESIADGDREIINELITIFLDQIPEFSEGLDHGLNNRDWRILAAIAHKAKSSVISMGMNTLGNIDLKNLELIAKSLRVNELQNNPALNEKEQEELRRTLHSLGSYPPEKQKWIRENSNEEIMRSIINNFKSKCDIACNELRSVLVK